MYLKRNKTVELKKVSQETEVDLELIYQFLQEGRITLDNGSSVQYPCKQCDTPIQIGSLCATCTNEIDDIRQSLQTVSSNEPTTDTSEKSDKKGAFYARD